MEMYISQGVFLLFSIPIRTSSDLLFFMQSAMARFTQYLNVFIIALSAQYNGRFVMYLQILFAPANLTDAFHCNEFLS